MPTQHRDHHHHERRRTVVQNWTMPMLERVRAEHVIIGSFFHEPDERAAVTEWWAEPSIVFTSHGAWEVRARRGCGDVTPDTVLVNEPAAEHDCLHPHGLGDRMLCVLFREDVDPGPALLVPHAPALHSLRRSLVSEMRSSDPDAAEIDALGMAMLQAILDIPATFGTVPRPGERSRELVQRLRAEADARYRDLIELRTGHTARLLRDTGVPVTDICFASGFGSVASFHSAFRAAYGMTPSAYRAAPFVAPFVAR
jgi:AraC-like DNA-binding protein